MATKKKNGHKNTTQTRGFLYEVMNISSFDHLSSGQTNKIKNKKIERESHRLRARRARSARNGISFFIFRVFLFLSLSMGVFSGPFISFGMGEGSHLSLGAKRQESTPLLSKKCVRGALYESDNPDFFCWKILVSFWLWVAFWTNFLFLVFKVNAGICWSFLENGQAFRFSFNIRFSSPSDFNGLKSSISIIRTSFLN